MSVKRLKDKESGFTLIEVTLAIVIGVVVIAGATVLYNQAKTSAGNSKAQSKVMALQQVVEEYAANNYGTYPPVASVQSMWKRKRPDDYNISPWGGTIGTAASASNGVLAAAIDGAGFATGIATDLVDEDKQSAMEYAHSTTNEKSVIWDLITSNTKTVKGYAVWIRNEKGEGPAFVAGPTSN